MIWRRETARALEARIAALEADQRAVRNELGYIRQTTVVDIYTKLLALAPEGEPQGGAKS